MKNFFKFLGIISLVLIIGFSMAACGDDDDDDGGIPSFEGTWTGSQDIYDGDGNVTSQVAYTVTIAGDDITISNPTGSITGTLKPVEESTRGYTRNLNSQAGLTSGYVSIYESKMTLSLSLSSDTTVSTALGISGYNVTVRNMTK